MILNLKLVLRLRFSNILTFRCCTCRYIPVVLYLHAFKLIKCNSNLVIVDRGRCSIMNFVLVYINAFMYMHNILHITWPFIKLKRYYLESKYTCYLFRPCLWNADTCNINWKKSACLKFWNYALMDIKACEQTHTLSNDFFKSSQFGLHMLVLYLSLFSLISSLQSRLRVSIISVGMNLIRISCPYRKSK